MRLFPALGAALMNLAALAAAAAPPPSACVESFLSTLSIDLGMRTDPRLLREILRDDMLLDDLPALAERLGPKLTVEQPLRPMLEAIRDAVERSHPAIEEFLCAALGRGLIARPGPGERLSIDRAIHHAFLLEELTKGMADDLPFMESVRAHLLEKREALGVSGPAGVFEATGGLFEVAKTFSIDAGMESISKVRRQGDFTAADTRTWRRGLELNILEAMTTEWRNGFADNAASGLALARRPIRSFRVTGENRVMELEQPERWTSLYETWNLAFITANVKHPGILFPKLLIPQVVAAKPSEYLYKRVLALWTSIQFYLFAEVRKSDTTEIPRRRELARLWGRINRAQAQALR